MKKLLLFLLLLVTAWSVRGQGIFSLEVLPVCWTISGTDSTLYAYWQLSSRDDEPKVKSYLNAQGQEVNVSAGGTFVPGYCNMPTASTYLDSLSVLEDSIIVLYAQDGTEIARDTVGPFGGGDGTIVLASNGLNDQDPSSEVDVELGGTLERPTVVDGDNSTYPMEFRQVQHFYVTSYQATDSSGIYLLPRDLVMSIRQGNDIQRIDMGTAGGNPGRISIVNVSGSKSASIVTDRPEQISIGISDLTDNVDVGIVASQVDTLGKLLLNTDRAGTSGLVDAGQVPIAQDSTGWVEFGYPQMLGDSSALAFVIDTSTNQIIVGQNGATYNLPYRDPDATGQGPGEFIPVVDELGAPAGNGGWLNVDSVTSGLDSAVTKKVDYSSSLEDISTNQYSEGGVLDYRGSLYDLVKVKPDFDSPLLYTIVQDRQTSGENLLTRSEDFNHGGANFGFWVLGDGLRPSQVSGFRDRIIAPDGTLTAELFVRTGLGNGDRRVNKIIDLVNNDVQFTAGETVTFSVWLKQAESAVNDNTSISNIFLQNRNGFASISPTYEITGLTKEWQRYSVSIVPSVTPPAGDPMGFNFQFEGDIGDTLHIWGFQLERNPTATIYKPTTESNSSFITANDTLYALRRIENRIFKFTEFDNATATLQDAVNFCKQSGLCDAVQIYDGHQFTGNLELPQYISLIGTGIQSELNLTPTDPTKGAIWYSDLAEATFPIEGTLGGGNLIKNLKINILDSCYAAIHTRASIDTDILNVAISGDDLAQNGIVVGREDNTGGKALFSLIQDMSIVDCREYGILYADVGNVHDAIRVVSNRSLYGIGGKGSLISIYSGDFEDTDSLAIKFSGGNVRMYDNYLENSECVFDSLRVLGFFDSRLSGGKFDMSSVGFVEIARSSLFGGFDILGVQNFKVEGNWWQNSRDLEQVINRARSARCGTVNHNYGDTWTQLEGYTCKKTLRESKITKAFVEDPILGDTIVFSNATILGIQQNLLPHSDSLGTEGTLSGRTVTNNVGAAPDGTLTADLLSFSANQSGSASFGSKAVQGGVSTGESLVWSAWVKSIGQQEASNFFILRIGGTDYQTGRMVHQKWTRIEYHIDSLTGNDTQLIKRTSGGVAGDSILIWGEQLNRGKHALNYVPTGATGLDSTGIAIIGGDVKYTGNLTATGTVSFPGAQAGELIYTNGLYTTGSRLSIPVGDTATINWSNVTVDARGWPGEDFDLLDTTNNVFTPLDSLQSYIVRLSYRGESSAVDGDFSQIFDIGSASPIIILERGKTTPRGANTEHPFSSTDFVYTRGTFATNGMKFRIYSNRGTTEIWDVSVAIYKLPSL